MPEHDDAMRQLLGEFAPPTAKTAAGLGDLRQRREVPDAVRQNQLKALSSALRLASPLRLSGLSPDNLADLLRYLVDRSPSDLPPDLLKLVGAAIARIRARLKALAEDERAERLAELRELRKPARDDSDDPLDYLVLLLLLAALGIPNTQRPDTLTIALVPYWDTTNAIQQIAAWGVAQGWTWPAPEDDEEPDPEAGSTPTP